jgi:hypothetical protein
MMAWTHEDTVECYKQGFAPFTMDDGGYMLLAVDDPEEVAYAHNITITQRFEGIDRDMLAQQYCQQKADAGDDLCKRALAFCASNPSKV